MSAADAMITRIELRGARDRAKSLKIALPKRMTAIRQTARRHGEGWFLVEGTGGFAKEIWAFNAAQAKARAINRLCERNRDQWTITTT